jgi:hypothetical protein
MFGKRATSADMVPSLQHFLDLMIPVTSLGKRWRSGGVDGWGEDGGDVED